MLITSKNTHRAGIQKRTIDRQVKIGPISFKFITLLICATVVLLFIGVQSQAATKSYTVYGLTNSLKDLERENEQLKSEATRLKSISQISTIATEQNLESVKSNDATYDQTSHQ